MNFEFATANRIIFGSGKLDELGSILQGLGERVLVTTPFQRGNPLLEALFGQLERAEIESVVLTVCHEPTIELIESGIELLKSHSCDLVVGFGGGSAIDTGKATAILATNPGDLIEYLEVIGSGKQLKIAPLPFIAIPTTAGTGSEVTRNAVIGSPDRRVKVSLRSPMMLPKIAIVDPQLTCSMPRDVTASTGMDAFTQLIEPYVSNSANPMTDILCLEGIARVVKSLRKAYADPLELMHREDMSLASLFGGMALANSKLGAVHGFAGPIGAVCSAPHGMICACLLPVVMDVNYGAIKERCPDSASLDRFHTLARLFTGKPDASIKDGIRWLFDLRESLSIPGLRAYGIQVKDFSGLVEGARKASSMKGNPIELTKDELFSILERSL